MAATVIPQQLITSGILEAYLLELTSDEDRQTIGNMLADSPELTDCLNDLDAEIGNYFLHQSVPPPPAIRNVIELQVAEQAIRKNGRARYTNFDRETHTEAAPKPNYVDVEVDNTHIRVHKNWRPAFIAVFVLSKLFLISALYLYFKVDSQQQEILRLKTEIHQSVKK